MFLTTCVVGILSISFYSINIILVFYGKIWKTFKHTEKKIFVWIDKYALWFNRQEKGKHEHFLRRQQDMCNRSNLKSLSLDTKIICIFRKFQKLWACKGIFS